MCVQDKRLRCSISRYSFHPPLARCRPHPLPPSRLFLSSSPRFFAVAYGASRERCSVPPLSFPPHHALCTASVSRVKLCAISLTFDNRCSSGNYTPPSARICSATSTLALSLRTGRVPAPSSFKCNPQEAEISSPRSSCIRRLDFSPFRVAWLQVRQVPIQFSLLVLQERIR